jgi:type I restriction enzyme S subunit
LLISITAELGMIALVSSEIGEAYVNQHVAIARTTRPINKSYLAWFFASEHGGKRQLEALRKGATKAGLGLDDIRSVVVALPPHGEQARIVAEIDRHLSIIREVESEVDTNLRRAQALRQSTLAKAFSS